MGMRWNDYKVITLTCSDPELKGKPISRSRFFKMWCSRLPVVKVTNMHFAYRRWLHNTFLYFIMCNPMIVHLTEMFLFWMKWNKVRAYHRFAVCSLCMKYNDEIYKVAHCVASQRLKVVSWNLQVLCLDHRLEIQQSKNIGDPQSSATWMMWVVIPKIWFSCVLFCNF
jgi:hypothetical protein